MSASVSAIARPIDITSAPHPLNGGEPPRAARTAGEAVRPVSPALTIAADLARAALEAVAIGSFIASVLIWAGVLLGRV
jgi:hypothetical protein